MPDRRTKQRRFIMTCAILCLVAAFAAPAVVIVLRTVQDDAATGGAGQAAAHTNSSAPATLRGAMWNAKRDRSPATVRSFLESRAAELELDFVLLQEFQDYHAYVAENPIAGYELVLPGPLGAGDAQNPILVRTSLRVREPGLLQLSARGYGTHAPMYAVSVVIGRLRLVSVHAPLALPFVDGRLPGPADRVAAYRGMMRSLNLMAARDRVLSRSTLLGGDWNARPGERGPFSPRWLARRNGLSVVETTPVTGPGHDRIDYLLTDGRVPLMTRHGTGGSDHAFMAFEVTAR